MTDLVIEVKHGGLGDHLFHSHLPRIAKETGVYQRVFYSGQSVARSEEVVELIWKSNPYVDGFVDAPGSIPGEIALHRGGNLLDAVMLHHGMDDGIRDHEPELFVSVGTLEEFRHIAVYDPNYVSFVGAIETELIIDYLNSQGLGVTRQIEPGKRNYAIPAKNIGSVRTKTLREYCQIIVSCKSFFCLTSGSATLAAALRQPSTAFYGCGQDPVFHHSRQHKYVLASSLGLAARTRAMALRLRRRLAPA